VLQTKVVQKVKTHILCSITTPPPNSAVYEVCAKIWWSQTGHRWQYNMAQGTVICMPGN